MNLYCKECGERLWALASKASGVCFGCYEEEEPADAVDLEDRLEAALAVEHKQEVLL